MPKLSEKKQRARRRKIENAALKLFKKRGYHGVGLRDIASTAKVSLGNIYNHFDGKEPIFEALIERLYADFAAGTGPLADQIRAARFPEGLQALGEAIGEMVETHSDYLTLVYVDIAEFSGRHVRPHYDQLAAKFEFLMAARFRELRESGGMNVDPAIAFTIIYMQFSNYFIVRRLIGADHLGVSDADAIRAITTLFSKGLQR